MVKGVGCDIVAVERIAEQICNEKFLDKVFTVSEKNYIAKHSAQSAAGIWASKEAVVKALGCGFGTLGYRDIEILHSESGQPYVNGSQTLTEKMATLSITKIHISISHDANLALAFAVVEAGVQC